MPQSVKVNRIKAKKSIQFLILLALKNDLFHKIAPNIIFLLDIKLFLHIQMVYISIFKTNQRFGPFTGVMVTADMTFMDDIILYIIYTD